MPTLLDKHGEPVRIELSSNPYLNVNLSDEQLEDLAKRIAKHLKDLIGSVTG